MSVKCANEVKAVRNKMLDMYNNIATNECGRKRKERRLQWERNSVLCWLYWSVPGKFYMKMSRTSNRLDERERQRGELVCIGLVGMSYPLVLDE